MSISKTKKREPVDNDYWITTSDPTVFRDYRQDQSHNVIAGVQIRSLHSSITSKSDANGLFTLEIPAIYRKGKPPSVATETLGFWKTGYQTTEYQGLVLNPGVVGLDLVMKQGTGTEVQRNLSIGNGENQVFSFKEAARELPGGFVEEILSFQIAPSTFRNGWTVCGPKCKGDSKRPQGEVGGHISLSDRNALKIRRCETKFSALNPTARHGHAQ